MSKSKLFEEFFFIPSLNIFFWKWGTNSNLFEELFYLCLDIFQEGGGVGLPDSKTFEELFCLSLESFQEEAVFVFCRDHCRNKYVCFCPN